MIYCVSYLYNLLQEVDTSHILQKCKENVICDIFIGLTHSNLLENVTRRLFAKDYIYHRY